MDGFLPATKSFWADAHKCSWKACQHKVYGVPSESGVPALVGLAVHHVEAEIRQDHITLDEFLKDPLRFFDRSPFTDDETEDVIDMVETAVKTDPIILSPAEKERVLIEAYIAVDFDGRLTRGNPEPYHVQAGQTFDHIENTAEALFHGSMDRIILRDDGTVTVDDLKTGWEEVNNPLERYGYVLCAKVLYPDATRFEFGYHYLRTGGYERWIYEIPDGVIGKVMVTSPQGSNMPIHGNGYGLLGMIQEMVGILSDMPCKATPGPHCESWYGSPCQFLGNKCPAGRSVPEVVGEVVSIAEVVESLPGFSAFKTLQAIADDPKFETTPELRSWALGGIMQLKGFLKRAEDRLKAIAKETGPIVVGDTPYGWFTSEENEVDKLQALDAMFRVMDIEDIAKTISISKTKLGQIAKRKYGTLGADLVKLTVSRKQGKPKFGPITNVEDNDE